MSSAPKSTARRDRLVAIEREIQEYWDKEKIFETEAPGKDEPFVEKFMGTFPFPYMNGRLHLGHSFSLSKLEFATGYERLRGKRALLPFGFHCTGMPIKACADKLKREIEEYGNPPVFPKEVVEEEEEVNENVDPTKIKKKHGKALAKSSGAKYQWDIMLSLGIPESEIPKFAESEYWLQYFPPMAIEDLKRFGLKADWRRSFITTDVNPYFDSFVRWQFNKLKEAGKIKFGKRYTIYSEKDGQPCMDHDRQSGEGVGPQEYTIILIKVVGGGNEKMKKLMQGNKVYLAAATLRPETMYGQTNCWIGPDIEYGAYRAADGSVYVCTERSAKNMSFQGLSREVGKVELIETFNGKELLGLELEAPLAEHKIIYSLPMMSVSAKKGTGVVTCVPSDSPDDYAALRDLKQKEALREKFGIKAEWVIPFEPIPIIETPTYGNVCAKVIVEELKITSQNDRPKLDLAKELAYKEGFYKGKIIIGEYKGEMVSEVKVKIRQELINKGTALIYYEPEKVVMSRSGDECVVALVDQWYVDYGEEEWRKQTEECLRGMNCYHEETRNKFISTLGWLNQWACSRSYGLGSRLPWDEQYLIESLSDSTIYMAFYTISHYLQSNVNGSEMGIGKIKPEQMTDKVWDYIFCNKECPETDINKEVLEKMKREFEYFYPLDLRVSGKDLVPNHLTFFLYNHTAIFEDKYWPKAVRANGHLKLNGEKMSKSTGNFLTLKDAIDKFSADACRLALAVGDQVEDANFEESNANAAILRLYTFMEFSQEVYEKPELFRSESEEFNFHDRVFENEINKSIKLTNEAFEQMTFAEAMKHGLYELANAKDRYKDYVGGKMHYKLAKRFVLVQCLLLSPISSHITEYIYRNVMGYSSSILNASFPEISQIDDSILIANEFLQSTITKIRQSLEKELKKTKKSIPVINSLTILVAKDFPIWQKSIFDILSSFYDKNSNLFTAEMDVIVKTIMKSENAKKGGKLAVPFTSKMKKLVDQHGDISILYKPLPFNEMNTLVENIEFIKSKMDSRIVNVSIEFAKDDATTVPGEPDLSWSFK
ncbi:leucyl-tRNA synthetase [Rozella allomycis CSF55]|uniref:leucine--tRNA ligase n=1 Tax=Rozella allomycis (strain CSF55) TaxID=988480 RepID=A0A075AMW7_ROZAC|nr:Aminoacyl-tRNA synthetase, class Ia domain-containing protein [Rozella allomycis CSF55]RKP20427.1 leucyl-tRNA synthetase [Rozella allomycis CSF55]|eukprot:EPZ31038.1 Aminoacyl-tRNA synthetase, class Ia domain-containing protein [Rozella allomycis CSF55]